MAALWCDPDSLDLRTQFSINSLPEFPDFQLFGKTNLVVSKKFWGYRSCHFFGCQMRSIESTQSTNVLFMCHGHDIHEELYAPEKGSVLFTGGVSPLAGKGKSALLACH